MVLGAQAPSSANQAGRPMAAETARAPAASNEGAAARQPAPSLDETYASREAKAKGLEKFKGGDVVVITGSTLLIVLLIILIIVII
jgi:hypothetical protein